MNSSEWLPGVWNAASIFADNKSHMFLLNTSCIRAMFLTDKLHMFHAVTFFSVFCRLSDVSPALVVHLDVNPNQVFELHLFNYDPWVYLLIKHFIRNTCVPTHSCSYLIRQHAPLKHCFSDGVLYILLFWVFKPTWLIRKREEVPENFGSINALTAYRLHLTVSVLGPLLSLPAVLGFVITIKEVAGWAVSPTALVDPVLPKIGVCVCARSIWVARK